jgi:ribonuclease BN (tRNA processing enzyme)
MQLKVLGCSGGIGGNLRTTSMLLDHDVLVDAGTGVGDLTLGDLKQIDHIFVTHSHLDHVACIPFLVDTVGGMRDAPVIVHATRETLETLRTHLFNWKIWPDFAQIPNPQTPYLSYSEIRVGEPVLLGGRTITPLPANHVVPAVGFHLDSGEASLVFTGDTTTNDALWEVVNGIENLRYLIIETAFSDADRKLAVDSKHLCPSMLADELAKLKRPARVFITHLKPGDGALTMEEVEQMAGAFSPRMLSNGQLFRF